MVLNLPLRNAASSNGILFSVNATIQPFKQLCSSDGEGVTNAEQGRERDRSTRLNLLPMAGGEAKPNHVFLSETVGFAQLLYSLTEGAKELFLIDQACLLGDSWLDHHEQISWNKVRFKSGYLLEGSLVHRRGARKPADQLRQGNV